MLARKPISADQVASSSAILLAETLIRLSATAAVSFWIARRLGPSQFGILNFASAFASILLTIAAMGMDTPVVLRLTSTTQRGSLLAWVFFLRLLCGLILFAFASAAIFWMRRNDPVAITVGVIVSLSIIANAPTVFDYWFKAHTVAGPPAIARTVGTLGAVIAKVICLAAGLGVVALAWTVTLEYFLTGIALTTAYFIVAGRFGGFKASIDLELIKSLLKEGTPYMWSAAAIIIYMKIDVVMLGYLSSDAQTGIYSLAQKLSEVVYLVPVVLIDSAYPALARLHIDSEGDDLAHGQLLFDLAVGGALVATIASVLLAGPVIHWLFGAAYDQAVTIFVVHAWSCIAIATNQARLRWFAVSNLQRYAPLVTGIGLALNVVANAYLIPSMGAMGAALATLLSYFISGYLTSFMFRDLWAIGAMQTRALWPWKRLSIGARIWHNKRGLA